MTANTSPFIIADRLTIGLPEGRPLVDGISFEIGKERVALVGESGSGKSLTARSLMGLLAPSLSLNASQLSLAGNDLRHLKPSQWQSLRGGKVAMVMQDPKYALNPSKTIGWQVEEPLLLHRKLSRRQRQEKVLAMLEAVGLANPHQLIKRYPNQLSGGMGQRIMLAIALITDPEFLIADEPTSALDHAMRDQVLSLIQDLVAQRDMGLLLISHDLQQVADHCQRVMVMYQGKILDRLAAKELSQATHPYTQTLWACRPSLATKGKRLPTLDRAALEGYP
ncbi:peptide ABC transporter ATP-binding protein [bacteria symbiont BFo2 of Frankliniella occidentalis]|nr:peptide ABC transporter ATP-binding protein [bacteria symbiont BFo2 of Frankliniella occidentalis]KYP94792.1 peptide ABC transporter ATP-binding protein [bacteria symbiont BFo2 of Frankliniella occidentalis]KYP96289.1 peptide ABC transporter ATP-binding protein [bacteria symbiont BFo2 of Frankliniella occidentalis]